jgi:hypothetical protein
MDRHTVRFSIDETGGVGSNWIEDRGGFFRPALEWEIEEQSQILAAPHFNGSRTLRSD